MPPPNAVQVAARARALSRVTLTLPDLKTPALTYEVEITDEDRAWASSWYQGIKDDMPGVPRPFQGQEVTAGRVAWCVVVGDDRRRWQFEYRSLYRLAWTGRVYRKKGEPWFEVRDDGTWRPATQEEIDMIELKVVWDVEEPDKEDYWASWLEGQLSTGLLGRERRTMQEGEEELLRARFEKHWSEHVMPGYRERVAAKEELIKEKREDYDKLKEEAREEATRAALLKQRLSDKERRLRLRIVRGEEG